MVNAYFVTINLREFAKNLQIRESFFEKVSTFEMP